MKEQVLATKNEIIIRDLYPILVSDKRLYIVKCKNRKFKSLKVNKIIQLDKISSLRYSYKKNKVFQVISILSFILSIAISFVLFYTFYKQKELFSQIKTICLWLELNFLFIFVLFLILALTIKKKTLWIEYPTNLNRPTKIVFKNASKKQFVELVKSIFSAIDGYRIIKEEHNKNIDKIIL